MDSRGKSDVFSLLLSLAVFSASYAALSILIRLVLGFEKTTEMIILVFMASLCVSDYFSYYRNRKTGNYEGDALVKSFNRVVRKSRSLGWLKKQSPLIIVLLTLLWVLLVSLLVQTLSEDLPDIMEGEGVALMIVVGLILAPVIETLISQVAVIEGCKRITPKVDGRDNVLFAMLVSSLLFAVGHGYSFFYIVWAFLVGLGLSALYVLMSAKPGKTWKNGFWAVVLLHFLCNALAFIGSLVK